MSMYLFQFFFLNWFRCIFGWRQHFIQVAEFAHIIAVALNSAVIAEQRAEFAASAAQILIVL